MLPITQMLLSNKAANPGKKLRGAKGVVIHWTANINRGANAIANRNYFNTFRQGNNTSAHYIVDDSKIVQCVKDDEIAYHVGAKKYTAIGDKLREKLSPNLFLIGIEMCVNKDGDWGKTYQNSVELVAYLLKKCNLCIDNLYRHYDITGKDCPKMLLQQSAWDKFKNDVAKVYGAKVAQEKTYPLLKQGMNNQEVKLLQAQLNKYGYKLVVDGDFGAKTESAVRDFQRTRGLIADGIVGQKTWSKLL